MLKPFFIAFTAGSLVFAIVAGCGSTDTNGSNPRRSTKGDDDDDDDDQKPSNNNNTNTSTADCSKLPSSDPRPACDECAKSKCCEEYIECDKDTACKANKKCVEDCPSGDFGCLLICANSPGADTAQRFGICVGNQCTNECPQPDAGINIDFEDGGL